MPLDPKIIREAQEAYRQWNEAELHERLHAVNKPSAQKAWRQYVALVEFCWKLAPQQSAQQRTRKVADLAQYYDRIHKLEAWRQRQRIDRAYAAASQVGLEFFILSGEYCLS